MKGKKKKGPHCAVTLSLCNGGHRGRPSATANRAGLWKDDVPFMRTLWTGLGRGPICGGLAEVRRRVTTRRVDVIVPGEVTHFGWAVLCRS